MQVTNGYLSGTHVVHVALEEAVHGHFDERANHQGAVAVADWTCEQFKTTVYGASFATILRCTAEKLS